MHSRIKGKKGYMAIKLDMSKAYDRVECAYLEEMMRRMGFANRWISLIMQCVSSVSYRVLVNGHSYGPIISTRGIRQGDPFSPYLFLLCAEGFSSLLQRAEQNGGLSGIPIAPRATKVSHLFFADDCLLFCRATFQEWSNVMQLIQRYEQASGQKINTSKTTIYFSHNTRVEFKELVGSSMGISLSAGYEKYLGLPSLIGRSKTRSFATILSRVWKRVDGWKEKFLSQAGRKVLIKAMLQGVPTYCMGVFLLPKDLCKQLNQILNRFWWGAHNKVRFTSWMSWNRLGYSKQRGGGL